MQAWGLYPAKKFLVMHMIAWDRPGNELRHSLLHQELLSHWHWHQVCLLRNPPRVVLRSSSTRGNHGWVFHRGVTSTTYLRWLFSHLWPYGGLANKYIDTKKNNFHTYGTVYVQYVASRFLIQIQSNLLKRCPPNSEIYCTYQIWMKLCKQMPRYSVLLQVR